MPVPVIDIFAGPGGLSEGFASLKDHEQKPFFKVSLSIEKTAVAHRTLMLRSVFRYLLGAEDIKHYYRYIRGEIDEATFRDIPAISNVFERAAKEVKCLELGKSDNVLIDNEIREALNHQKTWVLIGGPPCQAYSLAGRSRRAKDKDFHKDEKHLLYKEYLRIIQVHKPTIFVMENVKGLLSSKYENDPIFKRIITDLSLPSNGSEYEIRSFTKSVNSGALKPADYLVHCENYGIPQNRHRIILLGVRKGEGIPPHRLLMPSPEPVSVGQVIGDLPKIRSKLSRKDSLAAWVRAVQGAPSYVCGGKWSKDYKMIKWMHEFAEKAATLTSTGAAFMSQYRPPRRTMELQQWLHDENIAGVCQHEARSHMESDLARYLFSATFAHLNRCSPQLDVFPYKLLPKHGNVQGSHELRDIPFKDRFRVQGKAEPASTIVAHIAKDGHHFIHYDPAQCRSLTVREAARLQTFPDNYFFAGNRTEQYTQVGNAVPPFLAYKLAEIVRDMLKV